MKTGLLFSAASIAAVTMASFGAANAQGGAQGGDGFLEKYRVETDDCRGCGPREFADVAEARAYMELLDSTAGALNNSGNGFFPHMLEQERRQTQVVFLDFDAGGLPTFPICTSTGTLFGIFQDHVYTPAERAEITARVQADYDDFNYEIVSEEPAYGDYSTVRIGDNDAPFDCSQGSNITLVGGFLSILFGQADGIDFLNRNRNDNAFADASLWEFVVQFDPSGGLFQAFSGIDVAGEFGGDLQAALNYAVINQTANTAAHEVGHIQGLRHQNSFGAPGDGLPSTGTPGPNDFVPVFDQGQNATETVWHTMGSGASVGLSLGDSSDRDRFFSERSAARLAINADGKIADEWRIRQNGGRYRINLDNIKVPNTIIVGENAGKKFDVDALVIKGDISVVGETDSYVFRGKRGEYLNAELISVIGEDLTFEEGIMGQLRLYMVDNRGNETLIASNLQSFESLFDAEIFDAELPENSFYRLEVSAPDEFFPSDLTGDGVLDPQPLSTVGGAPELLTGRYSLQVYTSKTKLKGYQRKRDLEIASN
ncbi:hypothetical protein [Hyphococcus sp.]|uniref:hypothetical protein n=1 Tax=Hyphococcus sp. TaxID=2038636 RepID=UPI003CCBACEA